MARKSLLVRAITYKTQDPRAGQAYQVHAAQYRATPAALGICFQAPALLRAPAARPPARVVFGLAFLALMRNIQYRPNQLRIFLFGFLAGKKNRASSVAPP
jgi:hypothetical protein